MPYGSERAGYESQLSRAAVAITRARVLAETQSDQGAANDLLMLRRELQRLMDASLAAGDRLGRSRRQVGSHRVC